MTIELKDFIEKKYTNRNLISYQELVCPCCGECKVTVEAYRRLYVARVIADLPFVINSAYRCEKHNKAVGSTSENHTSGKAFDIRCECSMGRLKIVDALLIAGFKRIGIHRVFLHADISEDKVQAMWIY